MCRDARKPHIYILNEYKWADNRAIYTKKLASKLWQQEVIIATRRCMYAEKVWNVIKRYVSRNVLPMVGGCQTRRNFF